MSDRRELYRSPNGDTWFLGREPTNGHAFVIHQPNAPSGGRLSHIELVDFLRAGAGPEQQALLRLIGTLVEVPPQCRPALKARSASPTSSAMPSKSCALRRAKKPTNCNHGPDVLAISQPARAWISGQLLRAWAEPLGEPLLLGAEQHDIGWLDCGLTLRR